MGWFHVTNIWAEKINNRIAFKYRFEKIDLINKSWWAPIGSPNPIVLFGHSLQAPCASCAVCRTSFSEIFTQGWICLNPKCVAFWIINGTNPPGSLSYSTQYLEERSPWPKEIKPAYDLKPSLLKPINDPAYAYCCAAWKGMSCPNCGRCSSRRYWDIWRCETFGCCFIYRLKQPILSPRQVLNGHTVEYNSHALPMNECSEYLKELSTKYIGDWRINTYDLVDGNTVTHFQANKVINTARGGAHDLFMALQKDNRIGFQRFNKQQTTSEIFEQYLLTSLIYNSGR